jgi:hypothetical protein
MFMAFIISRPISHRLEGTSKGSREYQLIEAEIASKYEANKESYDRSCDEYALLGRELEAIKQRLSVFEPVST